MSKSDGKLKEEMKDIAVRAITQAAKETKVSVDTDAIGLAYEPHFLILSAPVIEIGKLEIENIWNEHVLDNTPLMCWHLSGKFFEATHSPIPAGSYLVVAHRNNGTVSLINVAGKTISKGTLSISINNPPHAMKKVTKTGGIDSVTATLFPPYIKVCGHVTVSNGKTKVTVSGCVEAGFP